MVGYAGLHCIHYRKTRMRDSRVDHVCRGYCGCVVHPGRMCASGLRVCRSDVRWPGLARKMCSKAEAAAAAVKSTCEVPRVEA